MKPQARHNPATKKGRATRERILRAAAELVAEKGAAGMSRRLDGGDPGAEVPALPAPERELIGQSEVAL
jgi:hypothetical protein